MIPSWDGDFIKYLSSFSYKERIHRFFSMLDLLDAAHFLRWPALANNTRFRSTWPSNLRLKSDFPQETPRQSRKSRRILAKE
jgi:hypothetical protein